MPEPKERTEKELAKMLVEQVEKLGKSLPDLATDVKDMKSTYDDLKDIDVKAVIAEVDKIKSNMEVLTRMIGTNDKAGLHIAGLFEERQKFSMLKAMRCIKEFGKDGFKSENWGAKGIDAGFEFEVMKEARAKATTQGQVYGIDTQGGFFVPDQVIPDVIQAIYRRSVLIDMAGDGQTRVSVLDGLVGSPVKIPKFQGGTLAFWIGEQDAFIESMAKVGNVTMAPKKLGVLTRITDEMMRWGSFGFENLLRTDMTRALTAEIDRVILFGKGTDNQPKGVFNMDAYAGGTANEAGGVQFFDAVTNTVITDVDAQTWVLAEGTFDTLDEMKGALEDLDIVVNDSFAYLSNPRFWRRLRQLKVDNFATQTDNQPYLLGSPMLRDETIRGIIGDFDRSTMIPSNNVAGQSLNRGTLGAVAKGTDLLGANWSEILFGRWSGIEISNDDGKGVGFASDETFFKLRLYCDVGHRHDVSVVASPNVIARN